MLSSLMLKEEEKSSHLLQIGSNLERTVRTLKSDVTSLADPSIRPDVRVLGIGGLFIPLDMLIVAVSGLRYGLAYTGDFVQVVPQRIISEINNY